MIVDDDPQQLAELGAVLARRYATVWEAQTAAEAVELWCRGPDLVLLDVMLGEHTSVRSLVAQVPDAATSDLVVMSGHEPAYEAFLLAELLGAAPPFLEKPFTEEQLWDAVRAASGQDTFEPYAIGRRLAQLGYRWDDVSTDIERGMMEEALEQAGSIQGAARLQGRLRQTFRAAMRRLGVERPKANSDEGDS
ncbi:MAG: response regulator [Myxococcales bacterium]|nr:response regulator [Myxococcales bacterium]